MIHGYQLCFFADLVNLFGACLSLFSSFTPSSCHSLFVLQRNNNHKHNNQKKHSCSLISLKTSFVYYISLPLELLCLRSKKPLSLRQADVGESTGRFNLGGCGQGDQTGEDGEVGGKHSRDLFIYPIIAHRIHGIGICLRTFG